MSFNRLGTLAAGVLGIGWLVAVGINLFVWQPQLQDVSNNFWGSSATVLNFVQDNVISWRYYHIGTTLGIIGLIVVIALLSQMNLEDNRWLALTAVGLTGALFALIASLFDQFATPVMARFARLSELDATPRSGQLIAGHVWEIMEPWRDNGLKTVSFWLIGFWTLWQSGHWQQQGAARLAQFTKVVGWALLLLAFVETMVPEPWVFTIGEAGFGGLVFVLFPIWGLWTASWFWKREVADAETTE